VRREAGIQGERLEHDAGAGSDLPALPQANKSRAGSNEMTWILAFSFFASGVAVGATIANLMWLQK
jgi:hypothetical protein